MPEEIVMVSTCPLCAGPEEVLSMVTVEIDRIIPKGRAAIMICRSCAGAVIRAVEALDVPLLSGKAFQLIARAEAPAESEPASEARAYPCPRGCALQQQGVEHTHYQKERDDDPSTD